MRMALLTQGLLPWPESLGEKTREERMSGTGQSHHSLQRKQQEVTHFLKELSCKAIPCINSVCLEIVPFCLLVLSLSL
jgi:hypothetical protein